ncbi:probable AMP-dependent synthetase and ligase [Crocosphaera subtropica ATCC 51142]|uniref:Probable AMP-dependent synthetase and ligase n=2 Tax=Crocosphaera TaxID=263510 RepID=B1WX72_CROS5|nr:probable AMP-dependent synthetase and ligase [Crocosphaera subtropica ATCC 51142]
MIMSFNTLVDLLQERSLQQANHPTYTFLHEGEKEAGTLTYGNLDKQAKAIAAYLQSVNAKGERVLLLYPPGLDFITGFFGCLSAGAIAIPAYPPRPDQSLDRLEAIATDAGAKFILTINPLVPYLQGRFTTSPILSSLTIIDSNTVSKDQQLEWKDPNINGDTIAFLQYTSGSTGKPKGVIINHDNLLHNLEMGYKYADITPNTKTVSWLPFGHNTGLVVGVLQPLYSDHPVILLSPLDFLQKPSRWLTAISRYQATQSLAPNFAYDLVAFATSPEEKETLDLSSWEFAVSGAEPIRAETLERFAKTFASCGFRWQALSAGYGMAESVVGISLGNKEKPPLILTIDKTQLQDNKVVVVNNEGENSQKLVGCGTTGAEQTVIIVNPDTLTQCDDNEIGEIWVCGPSVAQGYWNRPEATEEAFKGYLKDTQEGPFLRTGDLGFILEEELFVTGRLKDLIIIRGKNHYPQDIELTTQRSHQALRPSCNAAFSVDIDNQEKLVIVQEVHEAAIESLDHDQVFNAIRQAVSQQHQLQVYAILLLKPGTIPKTSSNKIQRHACKRGFLEENLDVIASNKQEGVNVEQKLVSLDQNTLLASPPEKRQELLQAYLKGLIANVLKVDPSAIDWKQPLTSMGLDSLTVVQLSDLLQENLGSSFQATLIFEYPTVEALANYFATEVFTSQGYNIGLLEEQGTVKTGFASPVIAIQSQGTKPPFFCVPGGVGTAFYLHALAHHLGNDQPFYGLQARGMDDQAVPFTDVGEMAAYYIHALKTIQPVGPYFLGGHSFGGQVAFEISQQLQQQGDEIGLLAIFDIPAPLFNNLIVVGWDDTKYMSEVVKLFEFFLKENLNISYNDLKGFFPGEQLDYVTERLVKKLHVTPSPTATQQVRGFVKVLKASVYAMAHYKPQKRYATPLHVFRSSDVRLWETANGVNDRIRTQIQKNMSFGWDQLSEGTINITSVPGDHITMMLEPNVKILAQSLQKSLQTI